MTDGIDLIERIKIALEQFGDRPWLPDLTGDLVKMGWRALYREAGLSPYNYATSRAIAKSVHTPRNVVAHLSSFSTVEVLDESFAGDYRDAGIEFYTAKEIAHSGLLDRVDAAINLIRRVPTLHETVDALVRSVHLIKPKDDDYDLSFSEPQIPFSIFISIPRKPTFACAVRVSEAIVHESMHLQLTLIERNLPLTLSTLQQHYSPWREEFRDTQGILHALYVFRVIGNVLSKLSSIETSTSDVKQYIQERFWEIDRQVREVQSLQYCSELTTVGACFVRRLI